MPNNINRVVKTKAKKTSKYSEHSPESTKATNVPTIHSKKLKTVAHTYNTSMDTCAML
jgi:hypothetical protein